MYYGDNGVTNYFHYIFTFSMLEKQLIFLRLCCQQPERFDNHVLNLLCLQIMLIVFSCDT